LARAGLMLYTVRAECAAGFEGTLRAVAEMAIDEPSSSGTLRDLR
jgi:hypothetical protein